MPISNIGRKGSVGRTFRDPTTLKKNMESLGICQEEINCLCTKEARIIIQMEQTFNELKKPHYEKRSEVIKDLPDFWFKAIMNHPDLSSIFAVDKNDEECLQFLNRIDVVELKDIISGYEIQFHFQENPFFENTVIKKEINFEPDPSNSRSTRIKWKDDITMNTENNSVESGYKKHLEFGCFFGWFFDNCDPDSDDIARIIKDDLWLNPLHYYLAGSKNERDSEL